MKKPKKQVVTGWVEKHRRGKLLERDYYGEWALPGVKVYHGEKDDWDDSARYWPPRKVRITVEYLT